MSDAYANHSGRVDQLAIPAKNSVIPGEGLPAQQVDGESTPGHRPVSELLAGYQGVLDSIGDLPPLPLVLRRHGGRRHYSPCPRWLLRYFVVRHIGRVLGHQSRRYSARAALGRTVDGEKDDREAVREFQLSLPPTRPSMYLVGLLVATVVIFRLMINVMVPLAVTAAEATTHGSELRERLVDTVEAVGKAFSANFASVNEALSAVLTGGALHLAIVTLGVGLSMYVVLRPLVPAFRLKRMLFNLAPEPGGRHRSAVARWSVSQATGLYELERRLFAELGARPPREFPLDLAVPALGMALPLALSGLIFRDGVLYPETRGGNFSFAACLLIAALIRLGWLYLTWRRRQLGNSGPYQPFEVGIRGGKAVAKVGRPIGVWVLVFCFVFVVDVGSSGDSGIPGSQPVAFSESLLPGYLTALVASVLVSVPWWYRINRELRDLNRSFDTRKADGDPLWSRIRMGFARLGLPGLLGVFTIGRRIQRAQARAGQPQTLRFPWLVGFGLVLAPVLFSYVQHELNKLWQVVAEPLDPWPDETSTEAREFTESLPWVKGLAERTTAPAGV